ncbi:uncharacterized protein LOC135815478 [Sycon ciliatum]|uniref:uncharacterized protein LOC135815478 n=1 Tax=Sycon ciliatum TaxID=27933 RepID=UPI0020AB301E|eukprot:scpid65128/ scgid9970/ 
MELEERQLRVTSRTARVSMEIVMRTTSLLLALYVVAILTTPPGTTAAVIPQSVLPRQATGSVREKRFQEDNINSNMLELHNTTGVEQHRSVVETTFRLPTLEPRLPPVHENASERRAELATEDEPSSLQPRTSTSSRVASSGVRVHKSLLARTTSASVKVRLPPGASVHSDPSQISVDPITMSMTTTSKPRTGACKPVPYSRLLGKFKKKLHRQAEFLDTFCMFGAACSKVAQNRKCLCESTGFWQYDPNRFPAYIYSVKCHGQTCPPDKSCMPKRDQLWVLRRIPGSCGGARGKREKWKWTREPIFASCMCA